jgi:hypothetical protein
MTERLAIYLLRLSCGCPVRVTRIPESRYGIAVRGLDPRDLGRAGLSLRIQAALRLLYLANPLAGVVFFPHVIEVTLP